MTTSTDIRTCPVCKTALQPVTHEGVELDRCPDGHGLWLDRGELRAVVHAEHAPRPDHERDAAREVAASDAGHAVVAERARVPRPCPICGTSMLLTEYAGSGIPIDECNQHGTWLDERELERIEAYAEDVRTQARPTVARSVTGVDVPAELLASIRTANVPPPA